ncbi:transposase domain-containing protein [Neoroseomonas lacus]|nr:transposase domain-containing protein [Neoroseomonas lacus]
MRDRHRHPAWAGVDPRRYFTDMLTRLVNCWPNGRIHDLMPRCRAAS